MLALLERSARAGASSLALVGLGGLCLLAALTLADGVGRSLLGMPIEGVRDIGGLAIAIAVASCLPMGLVERSHIAVRLGDQMGLAVGRVADLLSSLLVGAVCVAMAWQFQLYAAKLAKARETTWVLQIPTAGFWWVVAAILWAAVLVQFVVILGDAARLVGKAAAPAAQHAA